MFSQNLKYLRNKHNMEQIDLAHKLGRKSASSISEWEKGKYTPKMQTLVEIASIFNVNIDDLMGEDLSSDKESKPKNSFETIAAHLDGDLTEEEWQEILDYAEYVKSKRNK
ncbi:MULTISPECIES: helix-turn-helix transcriptional regulator [Staphylococcus]|uniref:Helix-turn-helix transcriptional regulator n=1 Tax=Staphylococcus nepalensis TaxID=214473 RepID=A0ABS3L055_9STAP|nr:MULTISPECIES: helix-turn-helix transcriptional regulator [Staphylococcus]MBO1213814.1 helix-turn-helix transcriptional regulator [Staphylococcus nepalensis]MBO1214965.1 helix-turn-helix transcriptional regulator [Staphylococcus nepalensis]MBO1226921.1 helix-turn-helix transcriptional regulator [Staphylococcus nepalensis]MBO1234035.1 helix-turn-helix transcriptional regulator [Staphylococcus nepalensis]MBO1236968.1 helix-turn-helix transcriptional regulator [Staphylococcus nepalensis]